MSGFAFELVYYFFNKLLQALPFIDQDELSIFWFGKLFLAKVIGENEDFCPFFSFY